jgi:hypothetical protein
MNMCRFQVNNIFHMEGRHTIGSGMLCEHYNLVDPMDDEGL